MSHSQLDDIPWAVMDRPYGRIEMKLIRCSPIRNTYTNLVRWPGGTLLPKHLHVGGVHSYTFAGRWRYLEHDWVASEGSYVYEPTGTVHTLQVEEDTQAIFMVEGGMVWYDDDGRMGTYQESGDLLDVVVAALAAQGESLPPIVLQD